MSVKASGNGESRRPSHSRATGSVTLADVAKIAGVSPITVSRAINRPELVTPQTIAHVKQIIARTGYVPNLLLPNAREIGDATGGTGHVTPPGRSVSGGKAPI